MCKEIFSHKKSPNDFPRAAEDYQRDDYLDLVRALQWHGHLYYTENTSEIPDSEYDAMMRLLVEVEKKNPDWQTKDSPSLKIGGEIKDEFPQAFHDPPMMSLDNAADWEEFLSFHSRIKKQLQTQEEPVYHAEPKFDGLGVELIYEKGVLKTGSTRGNGKTGEDITHNIRTIRNIPLRLMSPSPPDFLSVRGECILPIPEFEKVNREMQGAGQKLYANPRNVAAGTLRQKDSKITAKRGIRFFAYSVGKIEENKQSLSHSPYPDSQSEIYQNYLPRLGFFVSDWACEGTKEQIRHRYEELQKHRSELEFDIDGLVVKLNDASQWEKLGATSKAPRYAIALKFPSRKAITRITDVSFQVGRTGVITPLAHLQPINIGGVMVKRASLHNENEIQKLGIAINDLVEVERAGDVIPKVVSRQEESMNRIPIVFPEVCPACKSKVVVKVVKVKVKEKTGGEKEEERRYRKCVYQNCDEKILAGLKYSVSKTGLDIEGLGAEWVTRFYQSGLIRDLADIFRLRITDIANMEGMGDKLPQKIISAIDARREIKYAVFLRSLGIPNLGSHLAEVIAKEFQPFENLAGASLDALTEIYEIGEVVAESVSGFFLDKGNQEMLKRLFSSGFKIDYEEDKTSVHEFFHKKTFVFTGSLAQMTRSQAQEVVLKKGGKIGSSISKKTDYVVVGESAGSKLKKARELGIAILTEEEFMEKL